MNRFSKIWGGNSLDSNKLTRDSMVTFHDLAIRRENDAEALVGRTDINRYVIIPDIGARIIERLRQKKTAADIERELLAEDPEPVDVMGFIEELLYDYEFIHRIDGVIVSPPAERKGHFDWIPSRLGSIWFHPKVYVCAASLLLLTIGWIAFHPSYLPTVPDFFVLHSLSLNITLALAIAWILLFVHELAHVTAARSLGVICRIGLGHRFVFPVAETDMTGIILTPREHRYRAYLAGMLVDAVLFSAGVWIQVFHHGGWFALDPQSMGIIRMVHFHLLQLLLFQFLFFMKTDLYYVITTCWRVEHLLEHTHVFLRRLIRKPRTMDQEDWGNVPEREKRLIYGYAGFFLIGMALSFLWFIRYYVPLAYSFCMAAADRLREFPVGSWPWADALLLLVMCLVPFGVLGYSWLAKLRRMRVGKEVRTHEEN
ncbi:hypothetical protein ACFPPD_19990 [Cohnella suwonensis]|uniref:PqqD family protein n=1 Tax=Cohnella suwonensis TaxID=696072 RepID=A0ABW0LZ04_9BACL